MKEEPKTIPAAFTVQSPSQRWIFMFALQSGWGRKEVEFCLNAVVIKKWGA
jgi:hypothetical protein